MLDDSQEHWWKVKDEHGYVKVLYSLKWNILSIREQFELESRKKSIF